MDTVISHRPRLNDTQHKLSHFCPTTGTNVPDTLAKHVTRDMCLEFPRNALSGYDVNTHFYSLESGQVLKRLIFNYFKTKRTRS